MGEEHDGLGATSRVLRSPAETAEFERSAVADLHTADPASSDADKFSLVKTIGLQHISADPG